MGIIAAISNTQTSFPVGVVSQGGVIAIISLIVCLSIALIISDSKYWSRWASTSFDICSSPLLITFTLIVVFKVIIVL